MGRKWPLYHQENACLAHLDIHRSTRIYLLATSSDEPVAGHLAPPVFLC
jgi:hypothetical protein